MDGTLILEMNTDDLGSLREKLIEVDKDPKSSVFISGIKVPSTYDKPCNPYEVKLPLTPCIPGDQ